MPNRWLCAFGDDSEVWTAHHRLEAAACNGMEKAHLRFSQMRSGPDRPFHRTATHLLEKLRHDLLEPLDHHGAGRLGALPAPDLLLGCRLGSRKVDAAVSHNRCRFAACMLACFVASQGDSEQLTCGWSPSESTRAEQGATACASMLSCARASPVSVHSSSMRAGKTRRIGANCFHDTPGTIRHTLQSSHLSCAPFMCAALHLDSDVADVLGAPSLHERCMAA